MIGFGIGGLVHGVIADLHGRKTVLVYSTLILPVVGGITAAWENEVCVCVDSVFRELLVVTCVKS